MKENNIYKDLLEELLRDHFCVRKDYYNEDSLVWTYTDDTYLSEAPEGRALNNTLMKIYRGEV